MPFEDDDSRRAARERLQRRGQRAAQGEGTRNQGGTRSRNRQRPMPDERSATRSRQPQDRRSAQTTRQAAGTRNRRAGYDARGPQREQAARGRRDPRRGDAPSRQASRTTRSRSGAAGRSGTLSDSIPPIFVVGVALAAVAFVIFAIVMPNCSRTDTRQASTADQAVVVGQPAGQALADDFKPDADEPHQAALLPLLGEDGTVDLLNAAASSPDVLWIAAHADKYSFDGMELQAKALKLAAEESAAVPFVREYPTAYPIASPLTDESLASPVTSPSTDVPDTKIPHLYQWDRRWANTGFAGTAFGLSGSGPTCLAMVRQGLTGDASKTPYDIGVAAQQAEKATTDKQGLKAEYLFDGAADLGLKCSQLYPAYDAIRDALLADQAIILVVKPGQFTNSTSYVVLAGIAGNNKVVMNDPYSVERSSRLWDIDELVSASEAMYVYST